GFARGPSADRAGRGQQSAAGRSGAPVAARSKEGPMSHPRSLRAPSIAGVVGAPLWSLARCGWAQTADEQALQYRREAMEHALATKERYDLHGIRFDVDRGAIQPASARLLDDIAKALANLPEWRLRIVGHTDATGSQARNQALSLERA